MILKLTLHIINTQIHTRIYMLASALRMNCHNVNEAQSASAELTPSLPRCHLKTNDNNAKFEIFAPSFVLALPSEKIFVRTILKVELFAIGPENTLSAGMWVDFSAQKLYGLGQ